MATYWCIKHNSLVSRCKGPCKVGRPPCVFTGELPLPERGSAASLFPGGEPAGSSARGEGRRAQTMRQKAEAARSGTGPSQSPPRAAVPAPGGGGKRQTVEKSAAGSSWADMAEEEDDLLSGVDLEDNAEPMSTQDIIKGI